MKPIPDTSYRYGWHDPASSTFRLPTGLSRETVAAISGYKQEPVWMQQQRQQALAVFASLSPPAWGPDLGGLNLRRLHYYADPAGRKLRRWRDIPADIRRTYEKIGLPRAERRYLAGIGAQYDSEMIYSRLRPVWEKQGVIFLSLDEALHRYPDLVRRYFGTVIPASDNKFAALNMAVWSGGSFVYVPAGVAVSVPLHAHYRINTPNFGQFERTLIVAEAGSRVEYSEGCTAPVYSAGLLHAAVAEIIVKKGASVRYTTVQNWSRNVYNLSTKRMLVASEGIGEWVDANIGSRVTMKYPALVLAGRQARGTVFSLSLAGPGQHLDSGGKLVLLSPETSGTVTSKSVCYGGGRSTYRGLIRINRGARNSRAFARCETLILDPGSHSDTYPTNLIGEKTASFGHEATVSRVGEDQLFYLQSRGLTPVQATSLVINGFFEPVVRQLPLEYAVELNRLVNISMEGAIG